MVNLQMMILAQNKNNGNNHQCCKNNCGDGNKIVPMMMPGFNGPYPNYYPQQQHQMSSEKSI